MQSTACRNTAGWCTDPMLGMRAREWQLPRPVVSQLERGRQPAAHLLALILSGPWCPGLFVQFVQLEVVSWFALRQFSLLLLASSGRVFGEIYPFLGACPLRNMVAEVRKRNTTQLWPARDASLLSVHIFVSGRVLCYAMCALGSSGTLFAT